MKSYIYESDIHHKRFTPTTHEFNYQMDYLFLDLADLGSVFNLSSLWSVNRANLISFKRNDYLPGELSLIEQVKATVISLGGDEYSGGTYLLATPRRFGHCMNPIALFYCYDNCNTNNSTNSTDSKEKLKYVLAEVHNTPWDERHVYLLEGPDFKSPTTKAFHVSPFMPMNTTYEWKIGDPGKQMVVAIKVTQDSSPLFTASMTMKQQPIGQASILRSTRRQLQQAFLTICAIYFQAAKLWLKKVPLYPHPKNKLKKSTR